MEDDKSVVTVTTDVLIETLTVLLTSAGNLVPLVLGPAGIGKSSIARQLADRYFEGNLIDIRLGQLQEEDLIGIPYIEGGRTKYALPDFWPTEGKGLLFFDEPNRATKGMLQVLFQLVLDRRYFNYELPPGWKMLFAGNWGEANYFVQELDPALVNRFTQLYYSGPTYGEWKAWALRNGVALEVVRFLEVHPDLLVTEARDDTAYPTPRSWEMASETLKATAEERVREVSLAGQIGFQTAVQLLEFITRGYEGLPDPSDLEKVIPRVREWVKEKRNDYVAVFCERVIAHMAQGGTYGFGLFGEFVRTLPKESYFSLLKGLYENGKTAEFVQGFLDENEDLLSELTGVDLAA